MRLDELLDPLEPDAVDAILEAAGPLSSGADIYRITEWTEIVARYLRDLDPAVRERARTWERVEARLLQADEVWEIRQRVRARGVLPVRFAVVWDEVPITLP